MAEETASAAYEKGQLYMLSIGDIQPDPNQPRKYFDDESLAGLTQSIADKGVLQPILVRIGSPPSSIYLVAGERRLRAAQNAGLAAIPALFIDSDKPEEIALIENSLRQDLTAVEEAEAAGRMIDVLGYTPEQLQKILGKKRQTINDILSLNRLPAEIRDECRGNPNCPRRVLVEIARKKQARAMLSLYNKYKEKGLTSEEVRQEAKAGRKEREPRKSPALAALERIAALQERLLAIDLADFTEEEILDLQAAVTAFSQRIIERLNQPIVRPEPAPPSTSEQAPAPAAAYEQASTPAPVKKRGRPKKAATVAPT